MMTLTLPFFGELGRYGATCQGRPPAAYLRPGDVQRSQQDLNGNMVTEASPARLAGRHAANVFVSYTISET